MADQTATQTTHVDERTARRERRQALIDAGINPYPIKSEVTAHAAELEERYAELEAGVDTTDEYALAGRIRALRNQGKVAFIVLEDVTGQIQLFCRINVLGEPKLLLKQTASQFLTGIEPLFTRHLGEAGLGHISEIMSAEEPFEPNGCIAQAWSESEVLRALLLVKKLAPVTYGSWETQLKWEPY